MFRLEGPSRTFDRRVDAIRPGLADIELAHRHFAGHYVAAAPRCGRVTAAALRSEPHDDAPLVSQLLYGETFGLLDSAQGWAWGYCLHDHSVGYVRLDALGPFLEATHRVCTPTVMQRDDGAIVELPMGALIAGTVDGDSDHLRGDGFTVPRDCTMPAHSRLDDPVALIEAMVGAPYLAGGRTHRGIDAAALIQSTLAKAGQDGPRDMDRQLNIISGDLPAAAPLKRGDIVFFVDHVGIMATADTVIHASATAGQVVREPLDAVIAHIENLGHKPAIVGLKRPEFT